MQRQPLIPLAVADMRLRLLIVLVVADMRHRPLMAVVVVVAMRHRPLMAVVVVVVTLGVVAVADTLVAASTGRSTGS